MNIILLLALVLCCSCNRETKLPEPEPEFNASVISSNGNNWFVTSGAMLFYENQNEGGVIKLALVNYQGRTIQHELRMGVVDYEFEVNGPQLFSVEDFSDDFLFFSTYKKYGTGTKTLTWESSTSQKPSFELTVNNIFQENGEYYASGTFHCISCNPNSVPRCITIVGTFENAKCFDNDSDFSTHVYLK